MFSWARVGTIFGTAAMIAMLIVVWSPPSLITRILITVALLLDWLFILAYDADRTRN